MPPTWLKVAVGIFVIVEWVLLVLAVAFVVWIVLSWVSGVGSCTGITCW